MSTQAYRAVRITVPALVMVALMVSVPAQAACANTEQGDLVAPTGTGNPPPFMTPLLADLTGLAYYVASPAPGTGYNLFATGSSVTACVLFVCREVPDFNIAWYNNNGDPVANHNNIGDHFADDGFVVPLTADHGLVYMSHGPDVGTADGSVLARFKYQDGC